jgi:Trypsin-like peptidase domain
MALIPPFFVDCVVALGRRGDDGKANWNASGFLFGELQEVIDAETKRYLVYIVTNRHVLEGATSLVMRFNPEAAEPAREFEGSLVRSDGSPAWYAHPDPDVDVAVLSLAYDKLLSEGIRCGYFRSDQHSGDRAWLREQGCTEGDGIFALGFPMGMVGGARSAVIVRRGILARVRDCLEGTEKDFMIDATIFPGNSGGPVVLSPEIVAIEGTSHPTEARLIGIVKAYVPYNDVAVSQQTGWVRVIFQENSGLAMVHTVDQIREVIALHRAAQPPTTAARLDPATDEATAVPPGEASKPAG